MHELSFAARIVEIAEEYAKIENAVSVLKVEIKIGTLAGIVRESLDFALEFAVKNTILENAEIKIIDISAKGECEHCHIIFNLDNYFTPCPSCNAYNPKIIQGMEMYVNSLTFE